MSVPAISAAISDLSLMEPISQTPASEQPMLDSLTQIRSQLTATLSADTTGSTADAAASNLLLDNAWITVVDIVKQLSSLRSNSNDQEVVKETEGGMHIDTEADLLLDDVVPMFFQIWSKVGKVPKDMFKTYVQLIKIQHTLNNLYETGLFTNNRLASLRDRLATVSTMLGSFEPFTNTDACIAATTCVNTVECFRQADKMATQKHTQCLETLDRLQAELDAISPVLHPIHDRLIEIKEELQTLLSRKNPHLFSLSEVQVLQDELREIDSARIDGKYIAKDDGNVVAGQASVIELLESCFDDVHELLAAREAVSGENPLRPIYEDLIRIKGKLERLLLVGRWTLKSGDLVSVQMKLGEIDNLRVDGKFLDEAGGVPQGQAVIHFLLHKCYRLVYKLQIACEPVADSLMPTYNQLLTLQRCLNELKRWRVELTQPELIPYQIKLSTIDAIRQDGKFVDEDGEIPEGQGILHDLLSDCYELLRDLQMGCND